MNRQENHQRVRFSCRRVKTIHVTWCGGCSRITWKRTERTPQLYELTNKRMATGLDRLKDCQRKCGGDIGKAEELMRIAIDNLVASEFHMGKNDRGRRYIDWIDHLFKNTEKLEWWLDQ